MSWEVDVNFEKKSIRGIWIFRVEQQDPDTDAWNLVDEFIQIIPCVKQGNVQIQGGKAIFNPLTHDHITCDVPSFDETVEGMIDQSGFYLGTSYLGLEVQTISNTIQLGQICTGCVDPWVAADVRVKSYKKQQAYPVTYLQAIDGVDSDLLPGGFGLPEFQTEVVRNIETRHLASFNTSMSGWDDPELSKDFIIHAPQTLWSGMNAQRFSHTLAERNDGHPTAWTTSWEAPDVDMKSDVTDMNVEEIDWLSWAESISGPQSVSPHQPYVMSTGAMTLYIGHNPDTGQYFSGTMRSVAVDPGCIGH